MMRWYPSMAGRIRVRYTSADTGTVLAVLEKKGIGIYDVCAVDELTVVFTVSGSDLKLLKNLADRRGEQVVVEARMGLYWILRSALGRKLLLSGIMALLMLGTLLPGRILFISVEGNERIPARQILEAAETAGLKFGTVRRSIRSEQIKNRLLDVLPELKWAGVNTYGSRAVITVRERDDAHEPQISAPVRHIVAERDGIIVSCTVTDGCGVCAVGQAVKAGDILISGYTDCGITIRAEAASGRVLAETNRNLTVVTPDQCLRRAGVTERNVHFSLIIGKKRINFYKGSGISGGTCVKMSIEYVLTLPGGFTLPVSLVKETILVADPVASAVSDGEVLLKSFASGYLEEQMTSGTVVQKKEALSESPGLWILEGQYACIEEIGVTQDEKIGDLHGEANGTDRERRPGG